MILNDAITKFQRAMIEGGISGATEIIPDGGIQRFHAC